MPRKDYNKGNSKVSKKHYKGNKKNDEKNICKFTGKRKFYSELAARLALTKISKDDWWKNSKNVGVKPMGTYLCEKCHCWHLTSKKGMKFNRNKNKDLFI